jgi:hypothetical protein
MDAQINGSTVVFSGILDERTGAEVLRRVLSEARRAAHGERVRLDLSEVKRANSVGILTWFKLLDELKLRASYVNMPVWLVEQFNFSDGLRGDLDIESFQAPFYCPAKDAHAVVNLMVGRDVPLLNDYSDFTISFQGEDGSTLEPDFEPEEYLQFLINNFEKLKTLRAG